MKLKFTFKMQDYHHYMDCKFQIYPSQGMRKTDHKLNVYVGMIRNKFSDDNYDTWETFWNRSNNTFTLSCYNFCLRNFDFEMWNDIFYVS